MMLVKCIKPFRDLAEGTERKVGEQWDVDTERYRAINRTRYGKLVEESEQPAEEKPKPRRRTTKKQEQ